MEFDREALAKKMARANAILQQLKDPNLSEEEKKEVSLLFVLTQTYNVEFTSCGTFFLTSKSLVAQRIGRS